MKKNIFLYLFIISILALVYQQITFKRARAEKVEATNVKVMEEQATAYEDTITQLRDESMELAYFHLEYNDDALNYFYNFDLDPEIIVPQLKEAIYDTNTYEGDIHPLVNLNSISGGKIIINKVKMINHKWIIADFSDGPYWGEVLINYYIDENKNYSFEVIDSFLYPLNN